MPRTQDNRIGYQDCWKCAGEGRILGEEADALWPDLGQWIPCDECGGTGVEPVYGSRPRNKDPGGRERKGL